MLECNRPLVTVVVTTFNQEKYLPQAIDSILMQKVSFSFEIIIADDGSTDGTREIINTYARQYAFVKPHFQKKNVGISQNWYTALSKASGKYVTTLEGDDYWISPRKMQIQVDFLEENLEYIGVTHPRVLIDDAGKEYDLLSTETAGKRNVFRMREFLKGETFSYTSCMHHNVFEYNDEKMQEYIVTNRSIADFSLCMLLLERGNIYSLREKMSAYRISGGKKGHQSYSASKKSLVRYGDYLQVVHLSEEYYEGRYDFSTVYVKGSFFPFVEAIISKNIKAFILVFQKKIPLKAKIKAVYIFPFLSFKLLWKKFLSSIR